MAIQDEPSKKLNEGSKTKFEELTRENISPEDFETLVEVFRTLLKWSEERDRCIDQNESDGRTHHQSSL